MKDNTGEVSFSLRIVTVDYYIRSPVAGFDVTHSEFRGSEVKQVPILRIFGSSSTGEKTCLHVHGVFPYLYIPCEESDPEPKQAYQIANSIDKAINISLKHSNSSNQHVYKIVLVKGIPFYGFHSKHHQFYKIFFYNPLFIKRTADLLQSGAIMGVSYQPHEAHLNFVMQFFIDFNLYGMSFMNLEHVKFRKSVKNPTIENDFFYNSDEIAHSQDALESSSTCECELDCFAMHILNRREISGGNFAVNPGLEALWEDERKRHENLNMTHEIAPTPSQTRDNIPVTESHEYFDKKLRIKLIINSEIHDNSDADITLTNCSEDTGSIEKDSLNTSIYPAETPDCENTLNATSVFMHHPMIRSDVRDNHSKDSPVYSESIVDESIVIRQSQIVEDINLDTDDLNFMMLLEEMECNVEEDSILSTQINVNEIEQDDIQDVNIEVQRSEVNQNFEDSRFFMNSQPSQMSSWNDSYWENVENISQLDGTWEDEGKRRKKSLRIGLSKPAKKRKISTLLNNDNATSPMKKEQQLNLEEKFKIFEVVKATTPVKSPKRSPTKSPKNFEPLKKTVYKSPSYSSLPSVSVTVTPTKRNSSLDSRLKVKRLINNHFEKSPRNYSEDSSNESDSSNEIANITLKDSRGTINRSIFPSNNNFENESNDVLEKNTNQNKTSRTKSLPNIEENNAINNIFHKNLTASQYDRANNYQPEPGPSKKTIINNRILEDSQNSEIDLNESLSNHRDIISFYNTTLYNDSTYIFNDQKSICDDSNLSKLDKSKNNYSVSNLKLLFSESFENNKDMVNDEIIATPLKRSHECDKKIIILTPQILPPTYEDVFLTMENFNIGECKAPVPFYSSHKDVGAQIEIGQIVLKIKGNHINDLKEFSSGIDGVNSLVSQRQKIFMQSNTSQINLNKQNLDYILASNKAYVLCPVLKPPSFESVENWLKTRESRKNKTVVTEEVTHKIQVCIPMSPDREFDNSQMETLSVSTCSQTSLIQSQNQSEPICETQLSQNRKSNENKISQNSSESDEIVCGQKFRDDLDSVEFLQEKNRKPAKNKEINIINKDADTLHSLVNCSSEGLMSTTNAFKFSGNNYQDADVYHENDYLTIMSLEILTTTRGDLNPDPQHDPICAIFYSILNDCPADFKMPQKETGFIIVDSDSIDGNLPNVNRFFAGFLSQYKLIIVHNENEIFVKLLEIISKWNPDILCGYEIEMASWGYIFQRAFVLGMNLTAKISRVSTETKTNFNVHDSQDVVNKEIKLIGRIALDVWRLLRHEVALLSYSFENVMYHILHERVPQFSFKTLSFWWNHPSKLMKSLCVDYYLTRVTGTIRILLQLDLIGRTSELARLFGIQWYEVLSRGSQFRVESMMIRLSRSFNYVLVSPSVQQRAAMKAPECLPLILEPESRFYTDPVIVLDFQSLYPSMMIAYNYCFSTCIGKIENMGKTGPFQFGASLLRISPKMLKKLSENDLINWSPCGVGFVKSSVRKGILPTMLQNILNTRFMVKKAMKKYKNKTLQKILHNRQLGLKLIANVTYGYTAANFSGRMPCVEVGDSVVAKGRETLERAIKTVENTERWRAKVVYGDTDSLFVLVPGRSRSDAFKIGEEIAKIVTDNNPTPVKLKLEKVYQPCILQTKKRYVGYKYESKDQKSPEYEAKGIETVRRDGCPAASKILEKTLKILFDTYDVSKVKSYIYKKFQNIIEGKCNIQDFIFAREFRGMHAYKLGASIPSLEIAKRLKLVDPRKEPREGQRVPYVIVNGAPGEALLTSARCPRDLLQNPSLRINHFYYITRVIIPPLNRCFTLIGADVNLWFAEMPRKQLQSYPILNDLGKRTDNKKNTISQYFSKVNCVGCDEETTRGLCEKCLEKPQKTMIKLYKRINEWNRNYYLTNKICQSCCGRGTNIECESIDCPILFNLNSARLDIQQIPFVEQMKRKLIEF